MTTTNVHTNSHNDDCLFCQEHLEEAALRILEEEDRQRMECHLLQCSICRADLAKMEESLQLLAFTVDPIDPPASAKSKLLTRFEEDRAPKAPAPTMRMTDERPKAASGARFPRQLPWAYGSIAAGLCVALLIIGVWNFLPIQRNGSDMPRGQIQVMAMETTCPDCHIETGGQIGADPKEKDGMVVAWNLDPARKHEVWCVNKDGQHTKVGDLYVAETGSVMQKFSFPDEVGGYQQIYVIRDDGEEELSVVPVANRDDDDEQAPDSATPEE